MKMEKYFSISDIRENGQIAKEQVVDTNGSGHGALAGFLTDMNVDALICGGIGMGAKNALADAGIDLYGGVSGNADEAVKSFLAGNLSYNPDVQCSHHGEGHHHGEGCHGEGHHGEGHHCGENKHGCGGNGSCH